MKKGYFRNTDEWELWLQKNHKTETELWLVYYKKHTNKTGILYDDSVKVALCYGWIDGLVKKLDEESYARRFTPQKDKSVWSESNKKRVNELIKAGKMRDAGLHKVQAAKQNGEWTKVVKAPELDTTLSGEFRTALQNNPPAKTCFESFTKAQQNQFAIWINLAKRTETKEKRINESIQLLSEGKKLGVK